MSEKPKIFFAVSSEEAIKEGRLPLAFFEFREEAEKYRSHALQTGVITEWMIDRSMVRQTKENLVAVAMRIVTDRLKAPDLLKGCRSAVSALRSYQHGNSAPDLAKEVADAVEAAIAKAETAV